jgi:hypothetical protein
MCVAQPQACHSPHRWTTAELWEAGRGWPREIKRQEHESLSHGHWPCAPDTVQSPSWMPVYMYIYAACSRPWLTPLSKPPYGGYATMSLHCRRRDGNTIQCTMAKPGRHGSLTHTIISKIVNNTMSLRRYQAKWPIRPAPSRHCTTSTDFRMSGCVAGIAPAARWTPTRRDDTIHSLQRQNKARSG